jgi:hypothetical protein
MSVDSPLVLTSQPSLSAHEDSAEPETFPGADDSDRSDNEEPEVTPAEQPAGPGSQNMKLPTRLPANTRKALELYLRLWRHEMLKGHALRAVISSSYLLSDQQIKLIARIDTRYFNASKTSITTLLDQTDSWQQEFSSLVLKVIHDYDAEYKAAVDAAKLQAEEAEAAAAAAALSKLGTKRKHTASDTQSENVPLGSAPKRARAQPVASGSRPPLVPKTRGGGNK